MERVCTFMTGSCYSVCSVVYLGRREIVAFVLHEYRVAGEAIPCGHGLSNPKWQSAIHLEVWESQIYITIIATSSLQNSIILLPNTHHVHIHIARPPTPPIPPTLHVSPPPLLPITILLLSCHTPPKECPTPPTRQ